MSLSVQDWNAKFYTQTQSVSVDSEESHWRLGAVNWLILMTALIVAVWAYADGLGNLLDRWEVEEEYNHGYFLPLVTLVFLWQTGPLLAKQRPQPAWTALMVALLALLMYFVGELSAIYLLIHYSFIILLFALSLALVGWSGTRLTFAPIALLVFAVPIPYFLEAAITSKLQLVSSMLGVRLIRFCNIPVFRDGNLIDLGVFKLEVIEACSGLTYLFPLLGFGAICAYLYHTDTWKRIVIILSTVPIAILLNSFRIGMIGLLVKFFGGDQAQGFLHDFEGFAVFMVCVAILFLEMWVFTFFGRDRRPFREVFGLVFATDRDAKQAFRIRPVSWPLVMTFFMIVLTAGWINSMGGRTEIIPEREYFSSFPSEIGAWKGVRNTLDSEVLKTLDLTDYLLTDYIKADAIPVNLYVAYYASQRKGSSPHSPTVCLPGGGWQIIDMKRQTYSGKGTDTAFEYNRVIIRKGNSSQLVYYWFIERGQEMADEYQVKWNLFRDALLKNRTDGALVRVITPMNQNEPEKTADLRIGDFLAETLPLMSAYIPE